LVTNVKAGEISCVEIPGQWGFGAPDAAAMLQLFLKKMLIF